jgi:hypothetical protein
VDSELRGPVIGFLAIALFAVGLVIFQNLSRAAFLSVFGAAGTENMTVQQFDILVTLPDSVTIATPVPESSTWAMLLIGFAGFGFLTYRRRQGSQRRNANGPLIRLCNEPCISDPSLACFTVRPRPTVDS